MDKQTLQQHLTLLDRLGEIILRLAGNLQVAEGALIGTESEKEYNAGARYWEPGDVVALLHQLHVLKTDTESELEAVIYAESRAK